MRIEDELREEQLVIRADIERVANEVELINSSIEMHISRNTVCLESSNIAKKKRRRR